MQWFKNLSLTLKSMLGPMVMVAIILVSGVFSQQQASHVATEIERISNDLTVDIDAANDVIFHLFEMRLIVKDFMRTSEPKLVTDFKAKVIELEEDLQSLKDNIGNPKRAQWVTEIWQLFDDYHESFESAAKASDASLREQAYQKLDRIGPQMAEHLKTLVSDLETALKQENQQLLTSQQSAQNVSLLITLVLAVAGVAISYWIANSFVKPISKIKDILEQIASGEADLTQRLPKIGEDEVGQLAKYFNFFIHRLDAIINQVQQSAVQLASAAEEMTAISEETSESSQAQASKTEMVATAINQMAASILEVSRNVSETSQMAEQSKTTAEQGKSLEQQALTAIRQLHDEFAVTAEIIEEVGRNSESVNQVMEVITAIADQTNLLALNAAIEAARAGEQGRGFAVVADEVRTLAAKTQQSTEEIRNTIDALRGNVARTVENMRKGREMTGQVVEQAEQVDTALTEIVAGIERIDDMSNQIATATEEQSSVTEEINTNVEELRGQSELTAAATGQVGDAATELANLASQLQELVGQFKVGRAKI